MAESEKGPRSGTDGSGPFLGRWVMGFFLGVAVLGLVWFLLIGPWLW